jgi:hypothetical protein
MPDEAIADDELYRKAAVNRWTKGKLQIDDDATVSAGEGGAWVHAWVWVNNDEAGIEDVPEVEEKMAAGRGTV